MADAYLGYNFTAPILGSVIPQRLQNLCIRDYAQQKGLVVSFTVSEYWDHRRALMLFAQFGHGEAIRGFCFYSIVLLPEESALRTRFWDLVAKHRLAVHFALEDLAVRAGESPAEVERIHQVRVDPRLDETRAALLRLRAGA